MQEQRNEWNVMVFVTRMDQTANHLGQCHTNTCIYMYMCFA